MALWMIPLLYLALSILAGYVLPRSETALFPALSSGMSVSSAQAYLSAIASGMMTLTAIIFSVMFAMMQFMTTSYSKRLVLLFSRRDPLASHALGIFFATFTFALCTLQFVDRDHGAKVPLLSMEFTTILLVLSMAMLALLLHRMSMLQITNLLQLVGDRGRASIDRSFPRRAGDAGEVADLRQKAAALRAGRPVQTVRYDGVPRAVAAFRIDDCVRLATQFGGTIVMNCAVGDTVAQGSVLLDVYGATSPIPEASLVRGIRFAAERTFERDPKYPLRLLADAAIMALSPAVNDPTTAVQSIDQIEDLLHRLGRRALDVGYAVDPDGELRLIFPTPAWEEFLSLAFDEIRMYGANSLQVVRRLRAALTDLAASLSDPERVEALQRNLNRLDAAIARSPFDEVDKTLARQSDPQGLGHTRPAPLQSR